MLLAGLAGLLLLPAPWNVLAVTVAAIVEVAEVAFWIRFLRRYRVRTGAEGMIGERGRVIEVVGSTGGRVRVYGEIWAARAPTPLEPGERVRVAGVDGLTLEVEADPGTEKGP
jgi:membrane-bound serine protease (ClpP class)